MAEKDKKISDDMMIDDSKKNTVKDSINENSNEALSKDKDLSKISSNEEDKAEFTDKPSKLDAKTPKPDVKIFDQVSIFGKKLGMTRLFIDDGNNSCPVTVVEAGPCYVSQIKTIDSDGYDSIQISYGDIKAYKTNKAKKGHFAGADLDPQRYLKEFRVTNTANFSLGDKISVSSFSEGDYVTVKGKSIGRGFAGHMKRHGFGGGRKSHGKNSVMRKSGSIGAGSDPSRVWKGTRMAGRMGYENVSVKNLKVIRVDEVNNLLFIKGAVPGSNKGLVFITK